MKLIQEPSCLNNSDYIGSYHKFINDLSFRFDVYDNGDESNNIFYNVTLGLYSKDYSDIKITFGGFDLEKIGTFMISEHHKIKALSNEK